MQTLFDGGHVKFVSDYSKGVAAVLEYVQINSSFQVRCVGVIFNYSRQDLTYVMQEMPKRFAQLDPLDVVDGKLLFEKWRIISPTYIIIRMLYSCSNVF